MNIGAAAKASGLTAKMIRHYETVGLIPSVRRTDAHYRTYDHDDINILAFVRQSRRLGFSIPQIKQLLALWQDRSRSSSEVKRLAGDHLAELDQRIAELSNMKQALQHLMHHCHGDQRPDCPILEGLGGKLEMVVTPSSLSLS